MPVEFVPIDRDTPYLLPPSVQDYLPEDHLARFVAEMVDQLDMSALLGVYAGRGKKPYHPAMLVALLFYGYATGTFSSRKLEKATYDSIAFRYLCANTHPDHDTIASFRKRFLKELEGFFVEILLLGQALGLVKLGTVSLDGTKIKANASKHKALSWVYANKLQAQLQKITENIELTQNAIKHGVSRSTEINIHGNRYLMTKSAKLQKGENQCQNSQATKHHQSSGTVKPQLPGTIVFFGVGIIETKPNGLLVPCNQIRCHTVTPVMN